MTTERREPRRGALVRLSPLELRLYLAAVLAAIYAISWRAIGGSAPAAPAIGTTPTTSTTTPTTALAPRVVWLDHLPPDQRPVIAVPAGWQLASEPASSSPPRRVVRAPQRAPRVRTRSS